MTKKRNLFATFIKETSSEKKPCKGKLFLISMALCHQNCSDLMWENCSSDRENFLKFEAEDWEFAQILRSLEQFIQTVEGQNNFW